MKLTKPSTTNTSTNDQREEKDEMSTGTKVKIVAALLIVGFATYVAYWVQEPSQIRADVLSTPETTATSGTTTTSESVVITEASSEVAAGYTQEVSIADFAFQPATVTVEKGTTVLWTNKDNVPHTITGDFFSSGTLNANQTYSYTFNEEGEFDYTCSFHPQMKGKVIVGQVTAQTSAETTQPMTEELAPAALETAAQPTEVLVPEDAAAVTLSPETLMNEVESPTMETAPSVATKEKIALNASASEKNVKLTKSGPEDLLYFGIFGLILYFNRKKLKFAGFFKR